jgi:hypothetical protein
MTKNFHRQNKTLWLKSFDKDWLVVALESRRTSSFQSRLKEAWEALFGRKNVIHISLDRQDVVDMIEFLKEIK